MSYHAAGAIDPYGFYLGGSSVLDSVEFSIQENLEWEKSENAKFKVGQKLLWLGIGISAAAGRPQSLRRIYTDYPPVAGYRRVGRPISSCSRSIALQRGTVVPPE